MEYLKLIKYGFYDLVLIKIEYVMMFITEFLSLFLGEILSFTCTYLQCRIDIRPKTSWPQWRFMCYIGICRQCETQLRQLRLVNS
jgi:hypothetical protein